MAGINFRRLGAAACLVAGLGLGTWFLARTLSEEGPGLEPSQMQVDVAAEDITLSQGRNGKLAWRLDALRATFDRETAMIVVTEPRVESTSPEGEPVNLAAPQGRVDQEGGSLLLGPGVEGNIGALTLTADELRYEGQGSLRATGQVRLARQGSVLTAPEVRYDIDTGRIAAQGGIRLEFSRTAEGAKEGTRG